MGAFVRRHPLFSYMVAAYGITWAIASPMILSALGLIDSKPPMSLHYLTAFGPMLAAIMVTGVVEGAPGLQDLWRRMTRYRVGLRWLLIASVSPVLVYAFAAVVLLLFTGQSPNLAGLGAVNFLPNLGIAAWLLWIMTSGFGEETGWRGFALPYLQRNRSALSASLILGAFWIGWHVPFFVYLPSYTQLSFPMFLGFATGILAGAILYTWLYNSTGGSILMVSLFHGAFNFVTSAPDQGVAMPAVVSTMVMIAAVLVVLFYPRSTLSRAEKQIATA